MTIISLGSLPQSCHSRVALIDNRGASTTYAGLIDRVERAKACLAEHAQGVEGRLVLVPGDSRPESIVRMLAIWSLGGVVMPMHPRWSLNETSALVDQAMPAFDWRGELPVATAKDVSRVPCASGEDAAVVMFSSGTTGRRKGIVLTHQNLRAAADASAANLGWSPKDRWALSIPLAHVGGLSIVTRCLLAGAGIVCVPRFKAERYHTFIERHRVTLDSLVPTMLTRVMRARETAPASLRALLIGGAAAPPPLIRKARDSGWPIRLTYGMTETAAQFCTQRADDTRNDGAGQPLAGCEVDIRDGVLWVRGPSVARDTLPGSAPLVRDDDGWLCTGDAAQLRDDGSVLIRSRLTELIISGGENVYPQEVERVLSESALVEGVCVVGQPSEEWGHTVVALVAFGAGNTGADGVESALETLQEHARGALAAYARPKRYLVVDGLPETPGGKLDRSAALALASPPNGQTPADR